MEHLPDSLKQQSSLPMENLIEEEDGNAEFDLVVHPEK